MAWYWILIIIGYFAIGIGLQWANGKYEFVADDDEFMAPEVLWLLWGGLVLFYLFIAAIFLAISPLIGIGKIAMWAKRKGENSKGKQKIPVKQKEKVDLCPCHGGVHYYLPGDTALKATGVYYPTSKSEESLSS